jgi:hypothetical protein
MCVWGCTALCGSLAVLHTEYAGRRRRDDCDARARPALGESVITCSIHYVPGYNPTPAPRPGRLRASSGALAVRCRSPPL